MIRLLNETRLKGGVKKQLEKWSGDKTDTRLIIPVFITLHAIEILGPKTEGVRGNYKRLVSVFNVWFSNS